MDQFVHTLSGEADEIVERLSTQSAATMKEQDGTLIRHALFHDIFSVTYNSTTFRLMKDIKTKVDTGTWCGIPQNLLVPRYSNIGL